MERSISKIKHSLGSSLIGQSNYLLRLGILVGSKMANFWQKTMDYKWVKMPKLGRFKNFKLNTSSYRIFYGLSDDNKIIEIHGIELEL